MTTTEQDKPTRRVRVTFEPIPGYKPWRAVVYELAADRSQQHAIPVGRFDSPGEAASNGRSAVAFVEAGVTWTPRGEVEA